jgi:hypothetical protein
MEGQWFKVLYILIWELGKHRWGKKGQVFSDAKIALVAIWAAVHDRPMSWACRRANWHGQCPWAMLPSQPTMSRRLRTIGVWLILLQAFNALNEQLPADMYKRIDAHPLPVGGASKDRQAKSGYGAGYLCRGYKLHEIHSSSGHIDALALSPMRDKEQILAPRLISELQGGGYLAGDNQYDSNQLYTHAAQQNYQLLAPRREAAKKLGHCHHAPERLRAIALLDNPLACCGQKRSMGQDLLEGRRGIERDFAHETSFAGGLAHLPFWVRTPHRVAVWVQCKLLIYLAKTNLLHLRST